MSITVGGTQLLAADGALGTSGTAVRVYAISILSGATAGILSLRNGTGTGDTIYATLTCAAVSTSTVFTFGTTGMFFPNGCFVDIISNVTSAAVSFVQ